VTVGAIIEHVGGVMGRTHSLFGDPPRSGGSEVGGAAAGLSDAAHATGRNRTLMSGLSGEFASSYDTFAADAGPALDGLADLDGEVSGRLEDAAGSDRDGRAASGAAIAGATTDAVALTPFAQAPAGERALLIALRRRVVQQQRVVTAYRLRDARLAALLRSMTYAGGAGVGPGGAMPLGGSGVGGLAAPRSGSAWSPQMSGPSDVVMASSIRPAADSDYAGERAAAVPGGPGGVAVRAALSKRGVAYVWGAKGPENFDCSGLTEWAWQQAGVQLGPDTYTQVKQGIPVPRGEVRAGDLIFPTASFDGRGPGHVQLAISPTEVVHAPQTGDVVRIAPMPSSYVARRPVPLS
jgi:cell wall-associated NlpC family hydrolase